MVMKKILTFKTTLFLSLLLFSTGSFAQSDVKAPKTQDTSNCLTFTGKLDATMKNAHGEYTVKLIRDNHEVERQTIGVKKSFKFVLKRNMFYTIKVEKEGFIPRLFSISTTLPYTIEPGDIFKFNFETSLISADLYHQFDDDDMDFPLALISYGKTCDCFEYNRQYTEKIMTRIINRLLYGA
jgi:hypothetical protein